MTQEEMVRRMLTLTVRDEVTGYCPCCPTPDIELAYETGGGRNGGYNQLQFELRCKHQQVCKLRHDFMEGEGE